MEKSGRVSKYLDIAKSNTGVECIVPETRKTDSIASRSIIRKNPRIRPKRSYGSWEVVYFKHLINLRNIFIGELAQLYPEMRNYLRSPLFMKLFCKFIFESSSSDISFVEPLSDRLKRDYATYKELTP